MILGWEEVSWDGVSVGGVIMGWCTKRISGNGLIVQAHSLITCTLIKITQ